MKIQSFLPLAIVGLSLATASVANAAISLTNSVSAENPRTANGANVQITVSSFNLTGGNTVAVYFTAENANAFTATFDGVAMTVVQAFDGVNFLAGIAYLINPTASVGDVVINATNSGTSRLSNGYSVVSLSGVGALAGSDTRTSSGSLGYTTALDGGYVLGAAVNNNFQGPAPTVSGRPDLTLLAQAVDGNASVLHAHGDVPVAGTYSDTYGGSNFKSAATVAFNPVPEPSAALLGSLGALLLLRRRRN